MKKFTRRTLLGNLLAGAAALSIAPVLPTCQPALAAPPDNTLAATLAQQHRAGLVRWDEYRSATNCTDSAPEETQAKIFVDQTVCTPEGRQEVLELARQLWDDEWHEGHVGWRFSLGGKQYGNVTAVRQSDGVEYADLRRVGERCMQAQAEHVSEYHGIPNEPYGVRYFYESGARCDVRHIWGP